MWLCGVLVKVVRLNFEVYIIWGYMLKYLINIIGIGCFDKDLFVFFWCFIRNVVVMLGGKVIVLGFV